MPSRLALLVRKELAQHALAFVGLGALLALYFFVQAVGVLMAERSASFLEVHRAFLLGALVLAAATASWSPSTSTARSASSSRSRSAPPRCSR
jgi:zinc transporter ZupT